MFKIQIKTNIFDRHIEEFDFPYTFNYTIWEYLNSDYNSDFDAFFSILQTKHPSILKTGGLQFLLNLELLDPPEKIKEIIPNDGDILTIIVAPKFVQFILPLLVGLFISVVSTYISYLLMPKPEPPVTSNKAEIDPSPTYNWEGPTTSYALGRPVPIIYGDHSTGGSFINAMVEGLPFGHGQGFRDATLEGRVNKKDGFTDFENTALGASGHVGGWTGRDDYYNDNSSGPWGYSSTDGWGKTKVDVLYGAYFSNLFSDEISREDYKLGSHLYAPSLSDPNYMNDGTTRSKKSPMYTESMKGLCSGRIFNHSSMEVWIVGYKWFVRTMTWDTDTDQITVHDNWILLDKGRYSSNADDLFHPEGAGYSVPYLDGKAATILSPTMTNDIRDSGVFPGLAGVSNGEYLWWEAVCEATVMVHLKEVGWRVLAGPCRPWVDSIQYESYGFSDKSADTDKTYSVSDGMRMLMGVSEGEVCSIANLDAVGKSRLFHEDISVTINDTPVSKLFKFPDVAGYIAPLEIQTSRGANHTIIKYPQGQDSYVNLFNKRETNSTRFEYLIQSKDHDHFIFNTPTVCSAIDLTFNFPIGLYEFDAENAEYHPREVIFYIMYYPTSVGPSAARYWTHNGPRDAGFVHPPDDFHPESIDPDPPNVPFLLVDQRTNPFKLIVRVGSDSNPLPNNQYTIEIWRDQNFLDGQLAPPDDLNYAYDKFQLERIGEFGFEMLRYPNTAVMGLRILPTDKLSGAAPKVNFQVEGKYIKVPILRRSNNTVASIQNAYTVYSDVTGLYSWKELSGKTPDPDNDADLSLSTEETMYQYTNNPAFVLYDLITTQDLYPYLPESFTVWDDYVAAGEFCWEMLATHFVSGKQSRRFECNLVLDGSIDAATVLNQICTMYRLKLVWVGDKLRLRVLKPELPVQKFTDASILPKSYQESYQSYGKIPNTLDISFYNQENYYKQEVIQVSTKDAQVKKQRIIKQAYSLIGTTELSQAMRIAQYILAYSQVSDKAIQFKTTLQGLACLPGDVVRIQSSAMSYGYSGFLRQDPVGGEFYLDREIYLPLSKSGDYSFEVQSSLTKEYGTDTVTFAAGGAPHTFSSISGVTLTTPSGGGITVNEGDAWQLSPIVGAVTYTKDIRVTNISTDVEKNECTVDAEPYLPHIYTEDPLYYKTPPGPIVIPPESTLPPDVQGLALTQIEETFNIQVTYSAPQDGVQIYFSALLVSFNTSLVWVDLYYTPGANTSQLEKGMPLSIVGADGSKKGEVFILGINTENEYIRVFKNNAVTWAVGDSLVQTFISEEDLQAIDHTNVFFSENGTSFNLHGQDYSKGGGYIINLSEAYTGRTVWVRVQAVSAHGGLSPNPPTESIKLSGDKCLPSPSHLSMCSVGDGQTTFTGCDVCISWQEVSTFQGAGMGEDAEAGDRADLTGDFRITGHTIWIYNNATPNSPVLLRSIVGYKNTTYDYNHNMNKEDQYRYSGVEGKGYRDLRFDVYQEDTYGNVSCEPSTIALSNGAPDMSSYTPWYSGGELTITVDWSGFINDPTQMPEDVDGWEVWYGTDLANMTFIDVPDPTQGRVVISGLTGGGTYYVYVVPYDCFGTGTPRSTYSSQIITVNVDGPTLPSYIPTKPEGMAANISITGVDTTDPSYYTAYTTADLTVYGFDDTILTSEGAYAGWTHTTNYIYYNVEPGAGYCYVTATNLNTQNLITAIWWDSGNARWNIKFPRPPIGVLTSYDDYDAASGEPQVGQKMAINVWSELMYEEGGGIWGGGLGSVIHMRWFAPDPNAVVIDRLSHFSFKVINNDTGSTSKEHGVGVDKNLVGNYYTESLENLPSANSLSLSAVLWSNSGDQSAALSVGTVYVVVEVISDLPPVSATFTAVADPSGENIQFTINNWENIWDEKYIKQFEFYVSPGYYTFATDTWSASSYLTDLIGGTYEGLAYAEETYPDEARTKLRNKVNAGYLHAIAGASDAPVWQWTNPVCDNAGAECTYSSGGTCTNGYASVYGTGDCPGGEASGGCTYVSTGTCSRVVDTVTYNVYYVAVAVRYRTGILQWITYRTPAGVDTGLYVAEATLELINDIRIANASITTAKIGDLAVNNAKVRSLSAQKVWIGDSADPNVPHFDHCIYDDGGECSYHSCNEDDAGCPFKQVDAFNVGCPTAQAPGGCQYTPGAFAISRIFALYGADPVDTRDYTYIHGGFIMTNTIRANTIQVGALHYFLDIEARQIWDKDVVIDDAITGAITIKWHKAGQDNAAGLASFIDDTHYFIASDEYTFTKASGEMPDGDTVRIKIWIAYIDYIGVLSGSTANVQWWEQDVTGSLTGWDTEAGFTEMKRLGRLPLFAVVITNSRPADKTETFIGGVSPLEPEHMTNSNIGQLAVQIVYAGPSPGTFIQNDDITTGIIHNPTWTSFLDMRHYTSFDSSYQFRGHGRLAIDAPSSLHEPLVSSSFGDELGREWWNYVGTIWPDTDGCDTKLLIGRPYVDGLETVYPAWNQTQTEEACDDGYLWFYRNLDSVSGRWKGRLEVGGTLRVKDIDNYRDVLIGQEYQDSGIAWNRQSAPGIFVYNIEPLLTLPYLGGGTPQKLAQIGGNEALNIYEAGGKYTANYLNGLSDSGSVAVQDHQYTLTLDFDGQAQDTGIIPPSTFDFGGATLTVIPPSPTGLAQIGGDGCAAILIKPVFDELEDPAGIFGMLIDGNLDVGIWVRNWSDVFTPYARTGIHSEIVTENPGGTDNTYAVYGYNAPFAATIGENYGLWGKGACIGLGASAVGVHAEAYAWFLGHRAVALEVEQDGYGSGENIHIHFKGLKPGGQSAGQPLWAGEPGELVACEKGLWYRATDPTGWRYVSFA